MDATGIEKALVWHHKPARTLFDLGDRCSEKGIDTFTIDRQCCQLLLDSLLLLEAGLSCVVHGRAQHHVGVTQNALDEGKRAIAVERGADVRSSARVAVKKDVLPRDVDVIENDQGIDFVEAI